jgi:hypothetical protein
MAFVFLFFGILLLVAAARGTQSELFTLMKGDFSGPKNFFYWALSILGVGSVGYVEELKPVSDAFLVLLVVVLFLDNKGFFQKFSDTLQQHQAQQQSGSAGSSGDPITDAFQGAKGLKNPFQFFGGSN